MNERELFINEVKKRDDFLELTAREIDLMLQAWQASANRQGYKLVPVEPTEEMLDAARRRQWDDLSSPLEDIDILKYKAMINAI